MLEYLKCNNLESCYGCTACEQICPKKAIKLIENSEGFNYPSLNNKLCVNCGLCEKVCPYTKKLVDNEINNVCGLQNLNQDDLMKSSSGGVFIAMAKFVLSKGGFVAGCILDDNFVVKHILTNDLNLVEKMQGSKYVQSYIGNVYTNIKELLDDGKFILFSGTPCQVAGLKFFLMKEYNNLLTIDLICHGVPSQYLLNEYINDMSLDKKIKTLKFRDKKNNGWCASGSIYYKRAIKKTTVNNDSFYNLYLGNAISRMSCYSCKYSTTNRVGDITIGNFWNINDEFSNIDTKNGFSEIKINSNKGMDLFNSIKNNFFIVDTTLKIIVNGNGNLVKPCEKPDIRDEIYNEINKYGYKFVVKKYCHFSYIKPFLKKLFPKKIKKIIRRIINR